MSTLALLLGASIALQPAAANIDSCHAMVAEAPDRLDGYRCFLEQARKHRDWDSALFPLEAMLAAEETRGGAALYLAMLRADTGGEGVIGLYRQAADSFAESSNWAGEVAARTALADELIIRQGTVEAQIEADRAAGVAEESGDPMLLTRARLIQGRTAFAREQIARAWATAREVEGMLTAEHPVELRIQLHRLLGSLYYVQVKLTDAEREYKQALALTRQSGDEFGAATLAYSVALITGNRLLDEGHSMQDALEPMRAALASAARTGNLLAELLCRLVLGQSYLDDQALEHFARAAEIAERLQAFEQGLQARRYYSYALMSRSPRDPEAILANLEKALALARAKGDLEQEIRSRIGLSSAAWVLGEQTRAIADANAAFEALERGRSLQSLSGVRARWLSQYDFFYERISGWLLEQAMLDSASSVDDLEQAVSIIERFRARVFLDAIEAKGAAPPHRDPQHTALLEQIAAIQRQLRQRELSAEARTRALARLERLEAAELAARLSASGRVSEFPVPELSLNALQQALQPHEALITYQLSDRHPIRSIGNAWDPGSWVVLITRDRWTVRAVMEERQVKAALSVYLGLVDRADGTESAVGVQLYEALFGDVLEALPPTVRHLHLVLGATLDEAPLGALKKRADGPPLAARFELSRIPSLTAFLHARHRPRPSHAVPVLAMADPSYAEASGSDRAASRNALLSQGQALEPLPFAREEGRKLVRRLRGGSVLRQGEEASESWLKGADLSRFAVLHFGAHAVVDEANPERSAVVLTPGNDIEDGLLQARDLAQLGLNGQLVVLAACRSAAGEVVSGEGAMGLARAFLLAGAGTVVASLWPLQDDLAADLFDRFYRHLARGATVGAALNAAQGELREAGVPPRGWAGVIIIGDATMTVPAPASRNWLLLTLIAALLLATAGLLISKRGSA